MVYFLFLRSCLNTLLQEITSINGRRSSWKKYQAKAVQLSAQGQLTKWWSCVYMDLPWETLLAMPQQLLLFHLNTTYNKLPSPSNLCHYHINPKAPSLHCRKKVCTTVHVLGTCTVALQQGHFIFCHYSVLRVLVAALKSFLPSNKCNNAQSNIYTKLIKAGAKLSKFTKKLYAELIHLTADSKLLHHVGDKLVFHSFFAITHLRPGMVLFSTSIKTIIKNGNSLSLTLWQHK